MDVEHVVDHLLTLALAARLAITLAKSIQDTVDHISREVKSLTG